MAVFRNTLAIGPNLSFLVRVTTFAIPRFSSLRVRRNGFRGGSLDTTQLPNADRLDHRQKLAFGQKNGTVPKLFANPVLTQVK